MDYQKLLLYVKNLNTKNECLICKQDATHKEVNLSCQHIYHHKCLIKKKKLKIITCHYCNKITNLKKITKKCSICNKKTILKCGKCINHIHDECMYCTAIIKSGSRKNQKCGKKHIDGSYCKRHKKYKPSLSTVKITIKLKKIIKHCPAIIKSGSKKGNICNRKCKEALCGYHKEKIIVI